MRLQQGFAAGEMGFRVSFAQQQSSAAHVRFGSFADIEAPLSDVRFTPKANITERDRDVRFVSEQFIQN